MIREEKTELIGHRLGADYLITDGLVPVSKEILDMTIKALDQESSEDVMAIHTQGLEEGIRCAMCTNSMKNNRGCDGGCVVNDEMYKEVMEVISKQMFELYISDESVTPQPPKGHWIVEVWNNKKHHTCSVCQRVVDYESCYHYCPYCGAEMEVKE